MRHVSRSPRLDGRVRAAWQAQLAAARQTPGLLPALLRRQELLPRFAAYYTQLEALPRRLRRLLQRRLKQSLAGVALLLALGQAPALAATIIVDTNNPVIITNGLCSLIEALENANDTVDGSVHDGCAAGNPAGVDTIQLPAGEYAHPHRRPPQRPLWADRAAGDHQSDHHWRQ